MVELFNSTLKRLLRKLTQNPKAEWDKCLPYVLWVYHRMIHKRTGFSPYELLFDREMKMTLDQIMCYWKGKEKRKQEQEWCDRVHTNIEGEYADDQRFSI